MELSSIYSKTQKGHDEVTTRAHRLPFRVRAMLIMVDGHHTGHQLLELSSSAADGRQQLAALLVGGFIQAQVAADAGHEGMRRALPDEDISLARSYAIRTLKELLGSRAAALIAAIEQVETPDELRQHVSKLRAALSTAPDQEKAKHFLETLAMVLD